MPSHNAKVSQALRGHRAVTRKISRIKAGNATEVGGSKYDPRQSPNWIRNATDAQLNALIRKQTKFLDRSVQFVPDAQLKPLPIKLWNDFKAVEAKRNALIDANYQTYKDIEIGPAGMTVDSRMRTIAPLHAHMAGPTENPYSPANKSSRSVYGENGLRALIKDMRKKATKTHQKRSLENHRQGVIQMATQVGDDRMVEKIANLPYDKWLVLWKYTQFARNIKVPYNHYKDTMASRKGVTNSQMVENDLQVAHQYLDWAENIDPKQYKRK